MAQIHAPGESVSGPSTCQRLTEGFIVVDHQPVQSEAFPFSFPIKRILVFSIGKCILGFLLLVFGIVNIFAVDYFTSRAAFPIWYGLTVLANGIIGVILKCKQKKCLTASFLALSIVSLILTIIVLPFYIYALDYFINVSRFHCFFVYRSGYYTHDCVKLMSASTKTTGTGLNAFMVLLILCELAFAIGSVALSCKAYCKCCNTCNAGDCCTCLGCCECDTTPLNYQAGHESAPPLDNIQSMQMQSLLPNNPQTIGYQSGIYPSNPGSYNLHSGEHPVNQNIHNVASNNAQIGNGVPNNICSGVLGFIINIPSNIFGSANFIGSQPASITITINPATGSQIEAQQCQGQMQGMNDSPINFMEQQAGGPVLS